jgi:hypothetical protein
MDYFNLFVNIVKIGNILIRGIIDIRAYLKKKRLEQAEKDKHMEKTEQVK